MLFRIVRSGSSFTGKLLSQGLPSPNYVYEPMAYFANDLDKLISHHGFKEGAKYMAPKFKAELVRVFLTGQPKSDSFLAYRSVPGHNITNGGDVITKTIRVRYSHLKGWIENQNNFKVRPEKMDAFCDSIFRFQRLFI